MKIISIEGNIGAGKTTLIRMLKESMHDIDFLLEPIDKWQDVGGENLLGAFYKDASRYAFLFQCRAFMTRIKQLEEKMSDPMCKDIIVIERSWFSDRMCFSQVLREDGTITEMEWIVYKELFDQMFNFIQKAKMNIDKYIYVDCSIDAVYNRIKERNRGEESSIPEEYLKKLKAKHDSWLNDKDNVLLIRSDDPEMNYMEDSSKFTELVTIIRDFLSDEKPIDEFTEETSGIYRCKQTVQKFLAGYFYSYFKIEDFVFKAYMLGYSYLFYLLMMSKINVYDIILIIYGNYLLYNRFSLSRQMEMMCNEFDYVMLD